MKDKKKSKQKIQLIDTVSDISKQKYFLLSFICPFAILGTVFALHGVYPFGGRQILIHDLPVQTYPFLSGFWHKLREGSLSPWSWTAGAGHEYVAFIAYYLASPLNLLTVIVPHAWLREAMTVILLLKIGCAGLFTAMYLYYTNRQCGPEWLPALPVFSSLYALCAFTLGYYHIIMWFDSFALLPLVMLGLSALVNEGRFKLYVVSLALAVLANFYMGFFVCVFVAAMFFCQCVMQKPNPRDFLRKLGFLTACSVLAVGLTAALMLPAYTALQNIYSSQTSPPTLSVYVSFFDVLGNFIAFTPPTHIRGLSNLYCGLISIMLMGLFFQSKKIVLREKIALGGLAVFLVLSLNIDVLYLVIHGFRYPVGYPARFSFLISFILVAMAYRAFLLAENMDRRDFKPCLWAIGISAALFLLSAFFGSQEKKYVIGSAVVCAFYVLLFYFLMTARTVKARAAVKTAVFLVILTELSVTSYIGIKTAGTTDRKEYYDGYEQIQALLKKRQKTGVDFYRTDTELPFRANEPYVYYYDGLSFFSSTVDPEVLGFMQGLGLFSNRSIYNSFYYIDTSPLTNIILNVRYMISHWGGARDKDVYWKTVGKAGDSLLLENKYYLPLGFMVNEELAGYKRHDNPFISQIDFFSMATGIRDDLFTVFDISAQARKEDGKTAWNYQVPVTGMAYACCMVDRQPTMILTQMEIDLNETKIFRLSVSDNAPFLLTLGSVTQGDTLTFSVGIDETSIYVGHLDSELFERGYTKLAGQTLKLTKFTNTKVSGNVTAPEDGLLYTSIPGDKSWSVFVDGVKSEIVLIDNAMIAVRLNKGYHEIEFRYFNKSLFVGSIISLVSLGLFIALIVLDTRKHRSRKI